MITRVNCTFFWKYFISGLQTLKCFDFHLIICVTKVSFVNHITFIVVTHSTCAVFLEPLLRVLHFQCPHESTQWWFCFKSLIIFIYFIGTKKKWACGSQLVLFVPCKQFPQILQTVYMVDPFRTDLFLWDLLDLILYCHFVFH